MQQPAGRQRQECCRRWSRCTEWHTSITLFYAPSIATPASAMDTAHLTSTAPSGLCACRSCGVAEARLTLGIPETPCTDGRCIASWVADTVSRAVPSASDTRTTCRAARVGLRVSPAKTSENLIVSVASNQFGQAVCVEETCRRTMLHRSWQLHSTAAMSSRPLSRCHRGNSRCLG